ncbi:MAG: hypothetical protein ACK4M2_01535 [Brevundimonas sp.]
MTARVSRLTRQIDWARAEAARQRRIARRNQASPRTALHARRMADLAEATVTTLTELATRPAPAAYPNRLNLWMAEPDAGSAIQTLSPQRIAP